jgi:hypothetical protein
MNLVEEFIKTRLKEHDNSIKFLSTKEEIDKLAEAGHYFVVKTELCSGPLPHSIDSEWVKHWLNVEIFEWKRYYSDEIYFITGSKLKELYGDIDEVEDNDALVILDALSIECDPEFGFDTDEFTDDTGFKSWLLESLID